MSEDPSDWIVFQTVLGHLAELFEKKELKKPVIELLGGLSAETVRQAHIRLEEGHTKGKLVMTV